MPLPRGSLYLKAQTYHSRTRPSPRLDKGGASRESTRALSLSGLCSRRYSPFYFKVAFGAPRSQTSSESIAFSPGSTVFESFVSTLSSTIEGTHQVSSSERRPAVLVFDVAQSLVGCTPHICAWRCASRFSHLASPRPRNSQANLGINVASCPPVSPSPDTRAYTHAHSGRV